MNNLRASYGGKLVKRFLFAHTAEKVSVTLADLLVADSKAMRIKKIEIEMESTAADSQIEIFDRNYEIIATNSQGNDGV